MLKKYFIVILIIFILFLSNCGLNNPFLGSNLNENNSNIDNTNESNGFIKNGDFLINTASLVYPDDWVKGSWSAPKQYLNDYDGKKGVISLYKNSGGSGGLDVLQILSNQFEVKNQSRFEICFKIISASLEGDGFAGIESPVVLGLQFKKDGYSDIYFNKYYNITTDGDSAINKDFELVFQNTWVIKNYLLSDFGVSTGYKLYSVRIGGCGWDFESYIDYVNIY